MNIINANILNDINNLGYFNVFEKGNLIKNRVQKNVIKGKY